MRLHASTISLAQLKGLANAQRRGRVLHVRRFQSASREQQNSNQTVAPLALRQAGLTRQTELYQKQHLPQGTLEACFIM
jgi:hypothetical protein